MTQFRPTFKGRFLGSITTTIKTTTISTKTTKPRTITTTTFLGCDSIEINLVVVVVVVAVVYPETYLSG